MLPNNRLSSLKTPIPFLCPKRDNAMVAFEWGGLKLNDPTGGLNQQVWKFYYQDRQIRALAPNNPNPFILLENMEGITQIDGAFDQNMRPCVVYVQNGIARLWWYDSQVSKQIITTFNGVASACLSLDDSRRSQNATSDIIFAYIKDGNLYYRQQRERFAVERLIAENVPGEIWQIGMTSGNRFQFETRYIKQQGIA